MAQDEERNKAAGEVDPPPFNVDIGQFDFQLPPSGSIEPAVSNHGGNAVHSSIRSKPNTTRLPFVHANHLSPITYGNSVESLLECSTKLVELFRYPWETIPLMYAIVKDADAELAEAVKRIAEAFTTSHPKFNSCRAVSNAAPLPLIRILAT